MRITDRSVLQLIRMWLESPVVEGGESSGEPEKWSRAGKGTPQGGVISPLLSNLYLHWFDKVFCRSGEAAKAKPDWCGTPTTVRHERKGPRRASRV